MISRRISCRGTDHIRRRLRGTTAENSGANRPSPPFDHAPMSTFTLLRPFRTSLLVEPCSSRAAGDKHSSLGRAQGCLPMATDYASSKSAIGAEYQIEFGDPCHRFRGVDSHNARIG